MASRSPQRPADLNSFGTLRIQKRSNCNGQKQTNGLTTVRKFTNKLRIDDAPPDSSTKLEPASKYPAVLRGLVLKKGWEAITENDKNGSESSQTRPWQAGHSRSFGDTLDERGLDFYLRARYEKKSWQEKAEFERQKRRRQRAAEAAAKIRSTGEMAQDETAGNMPPEKAPTPKPIRKIKLSEYKAPVIREQERNQKIEQYYEGASFDNLYDCTEGSTDDEEEVTRKMLFGDGNEGLFFEAETDNSSITTWND
jgi:hypothetical protein